VPARTFAAGLSAVTTPYITAPAFILLAGLHFVDSLLELALYGGVVVGFTVAIPLAYASYLRGQGRVDSIHIYERRARLAPMALTGASSCAGLGLLYALNAPTDILRLGVLLILLAMTVLGATYVIKVSGHVTAWATGTTVMVVVYGPAASLLYLVALPVGWSRLALERHRPVEVMVGFAYGVVASLVLTLAVGIW